MLKRSRDEFRELADDLEKALTKHSVLKELRLFYTIFARWVFQLLNDDLAALERTEGILSSRGHHSLPVMLGTNEACSEQGKFMSGPYKIFFKNQNKTFEHYDEIVMPCRIGRKVHVHKLPLIELVNRHICGARASCSGYVPTLKEVMAHAGELQDYMRATSDDWLIFVLVEILNHKDSTAEEFTMAMFELGDHVPFEPIAELHQKLYKARGQTRSYNSIQHVGLTICGSLLQSILYPRNAQDRKHLPLSKLYPVFGKNLIDIKIPVGTQRFMVVFGGDLSCYTATAMSVWAVLALSYFHLLRYHNEEMLKPRIAHVDGAYFEFTLKEVLSLYVNMTTLCSIEYEGQLLKIIGGILGLKGNMTATMIAFAIECEIMIRKWKPRQVQLFKQLGGDDFFGVAYGNSLPSLVRAAQTVFKRVKTHIGWCGEEFIQIVPTDVETKLLNPFCKKAMRSTPFQDQTGKRWLRFKSLAKLPIMADFLTSDKVNSEGKREFLDGCISATKRYSVETRGQMLAVLRRTAMLVHDMSSQEFTLSRLTPHVMGSYNLTEIRPGRYITSQALQAAQNVQPLKLLLRSGDAVVVRTSVNEKLQTLFRRKKVTICEMKMSLYDSEQTYDSVICHMKEKKKLTRLLHTSWGPVLESRETQETSDCLLTMIERIKEVEPKLLFSMSRPISIPEWRMVTK